MADSARRRVCVVGAHGTSFRELMTLQPSPTLLSTPIAQRALLEDEVVVVSEGIEDQVPRRVRRAVRDHDAGLHAAQRRRPRLRRDLRRPRRRALRAHRRRAPPAVDARQDGGAGRHRPQRHPPAGAHPPPRRTPRAGPRDPRARDAAAVRRVAGAQRRARRWIADQRERCRVEMQEALSDLRSALERPLAPVVLSDRRRRWPPRWPGSRRPSSAGRPPDRGVDWPDGVAVPARSSRSPSRCSPRRCATSPSTPSPTRVEVSVSLGRRHVHAGGAQRRRRPRAPGGPGMGLRLAAFEALQHGGMVEFGTAEPGHWRVRLVVPIAEAAGRSGWASERRGRVTGAGRPPAARAGRRRPRRRALGLSRAARRAAVGGALPGGAHRRRGAGAAADAAPRRGARRPVPLRRVRRRRVRLDPQGVAVDPRAAHLRRRADVAGGRAGGRRLGVRLQGLGRPRGRPGGADGRAGDDDVRADRPSSRRRCSPSASARCST